VKKSGEDSMHLLRERKTPMVHHIYVYIDTFYESNVEGGMDEMAIGRREAMSRVAHMSARAHISNISLPVVWVRSSSLHRIFSSMIPLLTFFKRTF
jgi:hypothetical protein